MEVFVSSSAAFFFVSVLFVFFCFLEEADWHFVITAKLVEKCL